MSEFTNNNAKKIDKLMELSQVVIEKKAPSAYVKENMHLIDSIMPSDVIILAHKLVEEGYQMTDLKKHIAKLLNLFYKALNNFSNPSPEENSLLFYLEENNKKVAEKLLRMRKPIKEINSKGVNKIAINRISELLGEIAPYVNYFTIKENLLFPEIEKSWKEYFCVKIMWSIHDDIRTYIKRLSEILNAENFDLKEFNIVSSKFYFDVKAIIFRDEKILFPEILKTIPNDTLKRLLKESYDLEFPFVSPTKEDAADEEVNYWQQGQVTLGTGAISPEQISLIFNNLPIDLTFVDENNIVKYFSNPKHRVFPRTNAIIGRKVENCHPPESVHIVERIVDSFRSGKKDEASFWIPMGPKFVLIKYFAIRDKNNIFRGTLEVSQEISDIRQLKGEKRLLDWED